MPAEEDWPAALARQSATAVEAANARVWINSAPLPRVWIVHRVEHWPLGESSDPAATTRRFHAMLFPDNRPRNLRQEAIVETAWSDTPPVIREPPASAPAETCRLISERACQLEVEAELAAPGLLVLSNLYETSWVVRGVSDRGTPGGVETGRAEIVRTNGVMQGVFLPAGRHHLILEYAPRHLYWAAAVSGGSWLVLLVCLARIRLIHRLRVRFMRSRQDGNVSLPQISNAKPE